MSIPRVLAGLCAVAGAFVLAGPGWALLAAAAILYVTPATPKLQRAAARVRAAAAVVWRWLATGRQAVAAAAMPVAIAAIAVGLGLAVGVGWGLAAAGVAVGGLSVAADLSDKGD